MASSSASPLGELAKLPDAVYDALLERSARIAMGVSSPADLMQVEALAGVASVQSLSQAIVAMFLEATRDGTSPENLAADLSQLLPVPRARAAAQLLKTHGVALCAALEACNSGPPQLVDVQWHRSSVAAAKQDAGGQSQYVVTLTTRRGAELNTVKFTANTEQLSSLVTEVKSAVKQIDHECA